MGAHPSHELIVENGWVGLNLGVPPTHGRDPMPRHPRLLIPGAIYHVYCLVARGEFVVDDDFEAVEFIGRSSARAGPTLSTGGPSCGLMLLTPPFSEHPSEELP